MQKWIKKTPQIATIRMLFFYFTGSGTERAHCTHGQLKKEDAGIDLLHKLCVMRSQVQSLWWGFRLDWWRSVQQPQSSNRKQRCWCTSVSLWLKQTARLHDGSILNKFMTRSLWGRMFLIWTRKRLKTECVFKTMTDAWWKTPAAFSLTYTD